MPLTRTPDVAAPGGRTRWSEGGSGLPTKAVAMPVTAD